MCHFRTAPVAPLAVLALGLLVSLPAYAQEQRDDQTVGTPPSIGCCWGNAPDAGLRYVNLRTDAPDLTQLPATQDSIRREDWD